METDKQRLQALLEERRRHLDLSNARHRRIREAKKAGTYIGEKVQVSTPERVALASLPKYTRLNAEESRLRNVENSRINYRKNREKIAAYKKIQYAEKKAELQKLQDTCV